MQLHVRLHLFLRDLRRQVDDQNSVLRKGSQFGTVVVDSDLRRFKLLEILFGAWAQLENIYFRANSVGWIAEEVEAKRGQVEKPRLSLQKKKQVMG